MNVENRVRICRLIEKIETHKKQSQEIGVKNTSTYRGKKIL